MVTLHQKDSLPGKVIGNGYSVVELLGSGSVCDVYMAHQTTLFQRKVAVRVLKKSICSAADNEAVVHKKHFMLEAELLTRLKAPCFARLWDSGVYRDDNVDRPFVVMEFIEGPTAWEWARSTHVGLRTALIASLQAGEGLEELSRLSLAFRDLNPANLKWEPGVTVEPRARLYDMSHVLPIRETQSAGLAERLLVGVPPYAPPEQAHGASSTAGDVWSLAALTVFLIEGHCHLELPGQGWDLYLETLKQAPALVFKRISGSEAKSMISLLQPAFHSDPTSRPTMAHFLDQMAEVLLSMRGERRGIKAAFGRLLK